MVGGKVKVSLGTSFRVFKIVQNCNSGGSVVECLTQDRGVVSSLVALHCVIEQDTFLVQPRKTCPDMIEKVLTGT